MNGNYEIIETIKESERVSVHLAAVDGITGPVIVKEVRNADVSVYRSLKACKSEHFPEIYDIWTTDNLSPDDPSDTATAESPDTDGSSDLSVARQDVTIIEEYVDGETLAVCVKEARYSKRELLGFMLQLCDALETIHNMVPPLIHRDIKPSNILINKEGVLKLIDFDASRRYKRNEHTTSDTILLGTAEYAAPEQFGYQQTNEQSDIYSFGVLLADLFGVRIREDSQKKNDDFKEFAKKSRRMKRIESIIAKCTQFDPGRRYERISEVKKDLTAVLEGKPSKKLIAVLAAATLILAGGVTSLILCLQKPGNDGEPAGEVLRSEFMKITFTGGESSDDVRGTYRDYSTVEDLVGDSEAPDYLTQDYVTKLQTIESVLLNNFRFVVHYYPGLEPKKDFNYRNGWLDNRGSEVVGITLTDLVTQNDIVLAEGEWYTSEHIIFIKRDVLNDLREGFYEIKTDINTPDGRVRDLLTLNVNAVETDPARMLICPFDCLCFDPAKVDFTSFAVPHNEDKRIKSLERAYDRTPVEETLYRISEDGTVLSIDSSEFKNVPGQDAFYYTVLYEDGSSWPVTVYVG
ncbi:MAG: serine/threonine protein kinase [Lachnospiraceae bacterium]|nr:serine/threonine protein kinase [Lachnospiraceae bacterium]